MYLSTLFLCTMDTMKPNEVGDGPCRYDEDLAAGKALEICNDSFTRRWHDADCTEKSVYSKDELKNEMVSLYETIRGFNAVVPFPIRLYVAKALEAEGMLDGEAKSHLRGLYPAEDFVLYGE